MTAPYLSLVPTAPPPLYPIGSDERLHHWFLQFEVDRWEQSMMRALADPEVGYAYLNLIFLSQRQFPMGTLPADRRLIARLLRMPSEAFEALCRRDPSPLQHWEPCLTDRDEVRLAHPFVRDMLLRQLQDRERREAATSADAARKRLDRLRAAMQAAGFDARVIQDQTLVQRLDGWMSENIKGNRTTEGYHRAFAHAQRSKWFAARGVTA